MKPSLGPFSVGHFVNAQVAAHEDGSMKPCFLELLGRSFFVQRKCFMLPLMWGLWYKESGFISKPLANILQKMFQGPG